MPICDSESSDGITPTWLSALESRRKRPHKLAHEIGAGSPCLICHEKCKGLNLHFWRKICIECKCRREDHDFVDEEGYAQFEILFGAKRVKKTTLKFNSINKTFDWVPQNTPQDLVVDYLNALPQSKLPITNSGGATYRKQQLEKQLPLHDVNPGACHNLTNTEISEFGKYVDNLKKNVVGQGKIMKFEHSNNYKKACSSNHPPISLPSETVGNLLSSNSCPIVGRLVRDSDPEVITACSEKVDPESYFTTGPLITNNIKKNQVNSQPGTNQFSFTQQLIAKQDSLRRNAGSMNDPLEITQKMETWNPYGFKVSSTLPESVMTYALKKEDNNNRQLGLKAPSSFIRLNAPGSDIQNNISSIYVTDGNCNDSVLQLGDSNSELNKFDSDDESSVKPLIQGQNEFGASEKDPSRVKVMNSSCYYVPFTPVQESRSISNTKESPTKNNIIPSDERNAFNPTTNSVVPFQKCVQCNEVLTASDVVISTDRGGDSALWHAKCFICSICQELLVDLMYFFHKGKVYCGRDYATVMNIPRCFACDELIFVKEYTQAEEQTYHVKHFCCFYCDEPLAGKQYIPRDNHPVCLKCYQEHFGKNCGTCLKSIAVSDQRVSWGDLNFHVNPVCFCCKQCSKSLIGSKFVVKHGKTFCSRECVQLFQIE